MVFETYKEKIKERYSRIFDIEENYEYGGTNFDIFASLNMRNEKYFASKKITIYAFENDEYCFLKHFKSIDKKALNNFINILKRSIKDHVDPHHEHMSTTISGIIVVDKLEDLELIKTIEKFKYQKGFAFGFKGWADLKLILVDLHDNKVIASKKANKVGKFYQL
jgi:hypothetical protein